MAKDTVIELPPRDDCCPVCHGDFNLPCRTSCSHWFCGECILRVWLHGDATKQCKCPMCCRHFSSLAPVQAAFDRSQNPESNKIMENVRRYNRLHIGGMQGLMQKFFDLPFFIRMALQDMMDPDKTSSYLTRVRLFAMALGMMYVLNPFEFLPFAKRDILNLFDLYATTFVTIIHVIALCRARRVIRR
ncbi:E3 ubiquitin-protein ligase RNF170-like isoform X1 [Neltuma alba]|uniref:E3 ubiquitin-protein ligase RNF170-like isoform X1 n=1 Tax=Neltuma alba TaxID=207710 RepID=UPI0010A36A1E|nr:E3 ubiquitin-protein ligase RNF170-like isoform X1 [Prosopis alba]XP_028782206.1 E3 ubiquitin-protein ligase RNF170-like isoform X1 [Prosopis alba]